MQNEAGEVVDTYIPRKCSVSNKIISSKDHSSVQINVGEIDENGRYTNNFKTYAFSGFIRKNGEADESLVRLGHRDGIIAQSTAILSNDSAIGRRYILARTSDGAYSLVPDGNKQPSIPVQSKPKSPHHNPVLVPKLQTAIINKQPMISAPKLNDLPQEQQIKTKEEVVTLSLQGRDGSAGNQGAKGPPGDSGPTGLPGPPGVKGLPGTCQKQQSPCDIALLKKLAEKIVQLEQQCFKKDVVTGKV